MNRNELEYFRSGAKVLVAVVGLSLASGVLAQSDKNDADEPKVRGEFGKPLTDQDADGSSGSSMMISRSIDGQSYSVTIKDGKVSAEINGKPVPEKQIERQRDAIILKDENGKEVTRFQVGRSGRSGRVLRLDNPAFRGFFGPDSGNHALQLQDALPQIEAQEPPSVMLGVTMSDADEVLLGHLGYERGVMIDRVIDDLPAAKSGLEIGDIIVELDGKKPVDQEGIRAKLREAKPGDELKLKVIRKGEARDVKVALDAYDAEKLGQVWNQGDPNAQQWLGWGSGRGDEATKQLREALKMLDGQKDLGPEATKKLYDSLNEAMKQLQSNGHTWQFSPRGNNLDIQLDPSAPIVVGPGRGQVFEVPGGNSDLTRKIDKLTATIDKLTDRIEQLEKQLKDKNR